MRATLRRWMLTLAPIPLAACGDDDGSGPPPGMAAEVAGVYAVCQLVFVPEGPLAQVSIRDVAFETQTPGTQPPLLRVDPSREIQLAYTPRGAFVSQELRGTLELAGSSQVTLRFDGRGTVRREALLLPERLALRFQPAPQSLALPTSEAYTVPRADYARLSGQSETNLAEQIRGRLSAGFRASSCD